MLGFVFAGFLVVFSLNFTEQVLLNFSCVCPLDHVTRVLVKNMCFFLRAVVLGPWIGWAIVCCVGFALFVVLFVYFVMLTFFAIFAVVLLHRFGLVAAVFAGSVSCARVSDLLVSGR